MEDEAPMSCRCVVQNDHLMNVIDKFLKSSELRVFAIQCCCSRANSKNSSRNGIAIRASNWWSFWVQCFLQIFSTPHSRLKILHCLSKFIDTADLFLVSVVQRRGSGTGLQRETGCGHRRCGWVWWMTWRDRSGSMLGSTGGLFSSKRLVFICIACEDCLRTATKLCNFISGFKCFNLENTFSWRAETSLLRSMGTTLFCLIKKRTMQLFKPWNKLVTLLSLLLKSQFSSTITKHHEKNFEIV